MAETWGGFIHQQVFLLLILLVSYLLFDRFIDKANPSSNNPIMDIVPSIVNRTREAICLPPEQFMPKKAKYYIPTVKTTHLTHVIEAFDRAGYQRVWNHTDPWDVMWTFHSPFFPRKGEPDIPSTMKRLKHHQKVNHLPGSSLFCSKVELAKASQNLSYVPQSFLLPKQLDALRETDKELSADGSEVLWVKKGINHRGIDVLNLDDPSLAELNDTVVVQRLIRPYLIDGKMWDLGIYVAIPSMHPLRAYVYDNVLMRHCSRNYTRDLTHAHPDSYVVADEYAPPWSFPSLRPYFGWGLSTLNSLRAHGVTTGADVDSILQVCHESVLDLLLKVQPRMEKFNEKYPYGNRNFFSMYRFDFIIDENMKPWLVEVNQSPNLSSKYTKDLANMFRRISYSLLSLNGLLPGTVNHVDTTKEDVDIMVHNNDIDIGYDVCSQCRENCDVTPSCHLCRRCRTTEHTRALRELMSEHRNRQGFIRLYPPSQRMRERRPELKAGGFGDDLLYEWVQQKCKYDYTWC